MSREFDANQEARKITSMADDAAFSGTIVGSDFLINRLSCEVQSLKPKELRATLDVIKASRHFEDIGEFEASDGSIVAVAFNEKNGSGVVAEIKDPITEKPKTVCFSDEIKPIDPSTRRPPRQTDM